MNSKENLPKYEAKKPPNKAPQPRPKPKWKPWRTPWQDIRKFSGAAWDKYEQAVAQTAACVSP